MEKKPTFHTGVDWFIGFTASILGYPVKMCNTEFHTTDVPRTLIDLSSVPYVTYFKGAKYRTSGYGSMTWWQQRFGRWYRLKVIQFLCVVISIVVSWRLPLRAALVLKFFQCWSLLVMFLTNVKYILLVVYFTVEPTLPVFTLIILLIISFIRRMIINYWILRKGERWNILTVIIFSVYRIFNSFIFGFSLLYSLFFTAPAALVRATEAKSHKEDKAIHKVMDEFRSGRSVTNITKWWINRIMDTESYAILDDNDYTPSRVSEYVTLNVMKRISLEDTNNRYSLEDIDHISSILFGRLHESEVISEICEKKRSEYVQGLEKSLVEEILYNTPSGQITDIDLDDFPLNPVRVIISSGGKLEQSSSDSSNSYSSSDSSSTSSDNEESQVEVPPATETEVPVTVTETEVPVTVTETEVPVEVYPLKYEKHEAEDGKKETGKKEPRPPKSKYHGKPETNASLDSVTAENLGHLVTDSEVSEQESSDSESSDSDSSSSSSEVELRRDKRETNDHEDSDSDSSSSSVELRRDKH